MATQIITLILIGSLWLFAGCQILRFCIPRASTLTIVSLGAILGEVLYLFCVNAGSYALQVKNASLVTFFLLFILGVVFYYLNRKKGLAPTRDLEKPYLLFLIMIIAMLAVFYGVNLFFGTEINYDAYYHQPFAATIAEGNFPPMLPMNPDYAAQYHYGIDLLAASLISTANVQPWNAFNVLVLWNIIATLFVAFTFGRILTNNHFATGLLSAVFLFFGGTWGYMFHSSLTSDDFTGQMVSSYGINLFHNPTAIAVPVTLLIFCLVYYLFQNEQTNQRIGLSIAGGIALGILAIISEDQFVLYSFFLVALSVGFFLFHAHRRKPKSVYIFLIMLVVTAAVIAIVQGGVISDRFAGDAHQQTSSAVTQFQLRDDPGFIFWGINYDSNFISIRDPRWVPFLLDQFGPVPFLFPFILIFLFRFTGSTPQRFLLAFMGVLALSSFLIPIFIQYPVTDINFARVFLTFKHTTNILLGICIALILTTTKIGKKPVFITGLLVIASTYLFAPIAYNMLLWQSQYGQTSWGWNAAPPYVQSIDMEIAKDAKKIIPFEKRVLTNNIISVPTLWGRFVPYIRSREDPLNYNEAFISSFPHPTVENLKALKVEYVYVSPFRETSLRDTIPSFLQEGIDAAYLDDHPEWFTRVKEWNIDGGPYFLYKVNTL